MLLAEIVLCLSRNGKSIAIFHGRISSKTPVWLLSVGFFSAFTRVLF